MKKKLNIGAGPDWHREGWDILDHKHGWFSKKSSAWRMVGIGDNEYDIIFSSHMIEHIPYEKIHLTFFEINRVLKEGGNIRILCPDLKKLASAYVNDHKLLESICKEDPLALDMKTLGPGGVFMNFIISSGTDSVLLSRDGDYITGMAHLFAYDFQMLHSILLQCGFCEIKQMQFCSSDINEFCEPLHAVGQKPIWTEESNWIRPNGVTGFDRDPLHSLIIEARKLKSIDQPFESTLDIKTAARNFNLFSFVIFAIKIISVKLLFYPLDTLRWVYILTKKIKREKISVDNKL